MMLDAGDRAQATGWTARATRLLDEGQHDCVERGYLLLPLALQLVAQGNMAAALDRFGEAAAIGQRFGDRDLVGLARQGQGRMLVRLGQIDRGMPLLDEVMVAVTAGEVSSPVVGQIYCSVIAACFESFDMRRAQEWTDALSRWCAAQPDLVPYRGQCLVYRAEMKLLLGQWADALNEARHACERLAAPPVRPAAGAAFYLLAELSRLRGEVADAEKSYRRASEAGRTPQPGLALLWLAQGRRDAAKAAIDRLVNEAGDRRLRARLLAADVEILLAAKEVAAARRAADELASIAATLSTPYFTAVSDRASGAVQLAEGDARAALGSLRRSFAIWQENDIRYEAARVSELIGVSCRELGDTESGRMELDAARRVFEQLGATPDLERVEELLHTADPSRANGELTAREVQVLRLVARGKTNRVIAAELEISEKTVARHVSNIFTKLDLSSRSAATAYAYQHHLV
jgi:DNA-binding CsgD family transcriptional regulator